MPSSGIMVFTDDTADLQGGPRDFLGCRLASRCDLPTPELALVVAME
jgi:hypothetical protein